jgi:hypothetical protein
MTHSSNLTAYGLYQVGTESLVEYDTYTLGHSVVPGWKDTGDGDVFEYHHQKFPAKQPGAFFAAAVPYFFLHFIFGMSFLKNQNLVAALNCWLSVGMFASIAVGFFYELLLLFEVSVGTALITTATFAFGTLFFPYTGIPHHDIFATSCLIFGLFFLLRSKQRDLNKNFRAAGAWIGVTLFFSMLPALMVAILFVFGLTLTRKHIARIHFGMGFLTGYLPLGLFDAYYFGNPFVQANMAGNYQDTFFKGSLKTMQEHFHDYFGVTSYLSVLQIMPVFILGLMGIFFLAKRYRKEKTLFLTLFLVHVGYLLNISTIGHCQFGPRYLIPLVPFMMIGFAQWMSIRGRWTSRIAKISAGVAILYSLAMNFLGALGDTMYCGNLVDSPIPKYWKTRATLFADYFPVRPYCYGVIGLTIIFFFWSSRGRRNLLPTNRSFSELS